MKKSRFFKESKLRKYKDKAADFVEKGKFEKALSIYRDILGAFPHDTTIMLKVGDLCKKLHMSPEAVAVYSTAAEYHAQSGRLLQAIAVCRLILEIDANHSATQKKLAGLYAQKYGTAEHSGVVNIAQESSGQLAEKHTQLTDADLGDETEIAEKVPDASPSPPRNAPPSSPPIAEPDLNITASVNTLSDSETGMSATEDNVANQYGMAPQDRIMLDFTQFFEDDEEPSAVYEKADMEEYLAELKAAGLTEEVEAEERELNHEPRPAAGRNLVVSISQPAPPPPAIPHIPLFSSLNESELIDFMNALPFRHFDALETVVEQNAYGDSFFVIISGSVEIFRNGESLATLEEGAFFGEMAMLFPGPRRATVVTAEPCDLFEISNAQLDSLKEKHPRVARVLLEFAEERLLNNLLNTSPLFAPFCDEERHSLMEKFEPYLIDAGAEILREGEHADGLYVVVLGQISVTMKGPSGNPIEVETLKGNDIFGEMCLLSHQQAIASFTAAEQSRVLMLPRQRFNELIMTHPQVLELLSSLSDARLAAMNGMKERVSQL